MRLPALNACLACTVVAAALVAGCGGGGPEEDRPRALAACAPAHASERVVAAHFLEPGRLRIVYVDSAGDGEPCGFAVDEHEGILYVELRTAELVRDREGHLACVEGALNRLTAPDRLEPVPGTSANPPLAEGEDPDPDRFFAPNVDCPVVHRMQPSFIID